MGINELTIVNFENITSSLFGFKYKLEFEFSRESWYINNIHLIVQVYEKH